MASDCWAAYAQGFGDVPGLGNIGNEWLAAPMLTAVSQCSLIIVESRTVLSTDQIYAKYSQLCRPELLRLPHIQTVQLSPSSVIHRHGAWIQP